jgi:tetratricopeptide (TPR) repeat protein
LHACRPFDENSEGYGDLTIAIEGAADRMSPNTIQRPITIGPEEIDRVLALYDDGLYLSAYERALRSGPLESWGGTSARVLAGRLAAQLGAPRLAMALHARAWRRDPQDAEANYYRARELLGLRGPLPAWRFLKRVGPLEEAPDAIRADWLAAHALVLGTLRDFDAAEAHLARADEVRPEWPWVAVERAHLYELQDRFEDALAAARFALELRPWYRPAVQAAAHILQLLDRDGEAIELLTEAAARLEAGPVVAQLAVLQSDLGQHHDARESYDRYAALSPLMEAPVRRWLAGRRSDTAYGCDDLGAAIAFARDSETPFFLALADRLEARGAEPRRVVLEVGFVRQHHQTCAPATLAAISDYWGVPADHLEVAGAICYDGTPDHRQRAWAEQNGWIAREFTVTWDTAVALLDRGVPFTLATFEPQNSHLQAVIGYDARRRTLLLRDPALRSSSEAYADPFLDTQRAYGPRGMALVPHAQTGLLEGLDLGDAPLYDRLHELQVAIHGHDRTRAAIAYDTLCTQAPDHRLAHQAQRVLAIYDADVTEQLGALVKLLDAFPEDVNYRLAQLGCLRELARRQERLDLLADLCAKAGIGAFFCQQYAQELMADAREHATVLKLVQRVLRARPIDAAGFSLLAELTWAQGRFEDALELHRFAACVGDKDESLAWSYFKAARHLRREREPLEFLQDRFGRFGKRSSYPARTLYWAYAQLERMTEALATLDEAVGLRGDDGELLLFVAEQYGTIGEFDRASDWLSAAQGHCRRAAWLRTAARLASARGDLPAALESWQAVTDAEPAALDANAAVARLLAETRGRAVALDHLARSYDRFPHNVALQQTRIEWLRDEGPEAVRRAVERLIEIHPADAWARREHALVLSRQGRHDDAFAALAVARELEPSSTTEASVRGQVLERAGRLTEAAEAYREAIRRSADNDFAITRLIDGCDSRAQRRAALQFVESELERQVLFGDGLIAFARHARGTLEPDELIASLRRAWEARPDLWHAWSALTRELIERADKEAALALARQAAQRFPLLPRTWLDLAAACKLSDDAEGEVEALQHALRISPGWGAAARALSQVYERKGDYSASRTVLERAAAHAPLDGYNHGCLADALWHLGERELALERLEQALRLEPEFEWGWDTLRTWAGELDRPQVTIELALALTDRRGGEAATWLRVATVLRGPDHLEEQLAALDRALGLDPRLLAAHDLKAALLAESGRFDEALAACHAPVWGDQPPFTLSGRAAWIEARRGELAAAIARMRPIVARYPDYFWGLLNLTEWLGTAGTTAEYLEAAEALAPLAPSDPVPLGYRGDARLRSGQRAPARDDFRRALELAPQYHYAAFQLFDIELEDEDIEAASRTLASLKAQTPGEHVTAREVQLAVARSDTVAASEALRRLCTGTEGTSDWPIWAANHALVQAGWVREAEAIYESFLDRPEVHPQLGALWIERRAARKKWRCGRRLDTLLKQGEIGRRALVAYVSALGNAQARGPIRACIRRHRKALRQYTSCWGNVGYALLSVGRHRATAGWLSDWSARGDAEPWMLINLVLALRTLRRVSEANRVSRRALELTSDHTVGQHQLWLALDEAIAGDCDAAAERYRRIDPASFKATNVYLYRLAGLLLRAQEPQAEPGQTRRVLKETGRELVQLGRKAAIPANSYRAVRHAYHRVVRRVARRRGPVRGSLWLLFRWLDPPRTSG